MNPFSGTTGFKAFLGKLAAVPNKLYSMQPYQPGRIPVVFVHGTMSSPVWWTEMWNTLRADPELRRQLSVLVFYVQQQRAGQPVGC